MTIYFKDAGDGTYQFVDTAPQEWHAHLTPITKAEYDAFNPNAPVTVSTAAAGRAHELHEFRELRAEVLNALMGIAGRAIRAGDTTGIAAACDVAAVALTNITADPAVVAATDGPSTHTAIMAAWDTIRNNLKISSDAAAQAFIAAAM